MRKVLTIVAGLAIAASSAVSGAAAADPAGASAPAPLSAASTLKVSGNHLVTTGNRQIRLLGVQSEGLDFKCLYPGAGLFSGPHDQAMVDAMKTWNVNSVRVAINENCWLNVHHVATGGTAYQNAVIGYVKLLRSNGLFVIIDDHMSSDGKVPAGLPMPGSQAIQFWASVASAFRNTPGVVFDAYNEPWVSSWNCWRDGCRVPAGTDGGGQAFSSYQSVGMQSLVLAIRSGGAQQPILLGGLDFARDDSGWVSHKPSDPQNQLVVAEHNYGPAGNVNGNDCLDTCLDTLASIAQKYPVMFGEVGQTGCTHEYVDSQLDWADAHGIGYMAFTWNAIGTDWDCDGPALLDDYDGTPSGYGVGVRDHFLSINTQ